MADWTSEQILALAPDASSAKAGSGLASPGNWVTRGRHGQAVWGECTGSGSKPYQTQIDLAEPAFRCSCPSRKFPCKHGLGLFLMLAAAPATFAEDTPPAWVTEWLASRTARAEKQAAKAEAPAEKSPEALAKEAAAQAKRAAARTARVAAGLDELDLWLRDLVRHGLAAVQGQPHGFWEGMAARMVDAQAPGVARMVREMAGIPMSGDGWPDRLADRLGRLYLLLEGFRRLETLPPDEQADIRTMIGWTAAQEEIAAGESVRDRWLVLGQRVQQEEMLRAQRTWLRGQTTGRFALLLAFAHGGQPLDMSLLPGAALEADLCFWPSAYPLRALVKTRHSELESLEGLSGYPTVDAAVDAGSEALSRHPWLEPFPLVLEGVRPCFQEGQWLVRDAAGAGLPLSPSFTEGWTLLAVSGGAPVTLCGEWDGRRLFPLSVWAGGAFHALASS